MGEWNGGLESESREWGNRAVICSDFLTGVACTGVAEVCQSGGKDVTMGLELRWD